MWCGGLLPTPQPCWSCPLPSAVSEQTYCDRLVQDTPFLLGRGRLSEQQVDRIILQLNRYYPQILSNKDAQKVVVGAGTSHSTPPGLGEDRRWKPGSRGCLGPRASALPASMSPVMGTCGWPSRDARGTAGHGAANAPSGPGASQALPHCRRVCTLPPAEVQGWTDFWGHRGRLGAAACATRSLNSPQGQGLRVQGPPAEEGLSKPCSWSCSSCPGAG